MNHPSISSPSIVDTYSHFVLKGFLLKPFEQKPHIKWAFSSSEEFYLLLKIQNSKLLIQVLTKFTDQPSLFSQNHSLLFLFFLSESFLSEFHYCIKGMWKQSSCNLCLTHLCSRTADGSDSTPAQIIKGKLQYPHNSTGAESGSFISSSTNLLV